MKKNIIKIFIVAPILFLLTSCSTYYILQEFGKILTTSFLQSQMIIASVCLGFASLVPLIMKNKKRAFKDIEHGSACWGKFSDIKRLQDENNSQNLLFSKNVQMSMDMRITRRNRHVLVFGGSGSGKSRYYIKPNILQMNASYVITDRLRANI